MATKLGRIAKLGTLTTKVSGSYLGHRVAGLFQGEEKRKAALDRLHVENAEQIVASLGQLKGAAMKVGQAVAQAAEGIDLGADARAILGKLHDKAEPIPFATVKRRVEIELGGSIDEVFRAFDPEPLGTASLGQAHAARLPDGTEVVVKVLHEGVEDAVASDLATLKMMMKGGRVLRRPAEEIDSIFAEIEARLNEEVDYTVELANLDEFRRYFQGSADVTIPRGYPGWSTRSVLTMERLPGRPLGVFAATATPEVKNRAGVVLARAFFKLFYQHRAIHADPHPGNYLFLPDGRVGILDFGCVRRFDLDWVVGYGACGWHTRHGRRAELLAAARGLGALQGNDPASDETLWQLCRAIGLPFRGGVYTCGVETDTADREIARLVKQILPDSNLRAPYQMTFLHRALGGLYSIERQLKASHDWGQIFEDAYMIARRDAGLA